MSLANNALLGALGLLGTPLDDNETAGGVGAVTVQAGATAILGEATRFTRGGANFACIMKSVLSGDCAPMAFIINDTATAINFFPAVGEFNNGVVNQVLSIPAGQALIAIRVPNNLAGASSGWRSSVIP